MNQLFSFFIDNFPSLKEILIAGPPGLLWACACLYLAGYLKKYRGLNTGYTRKIFHFLIFTSAAVIHFMWGLPGVFIFGAMTSLVIFYALLRGDGHLLYEAITSSPHISLPWSAGLPAIFGLRKPRLSATLLPVLAMQWPNRWACAGENINTGCLH
jgi:hypothetical protein